MDWGIIVLLVIAQAPLLLLALLMRVAGIKYPCARRYALPWLAAALPNLLIGSGYYYKLQTVECGYACGAYLAGLLRLLLISGLFIGLLLSVGLFLYRRRQRGGA